MQIFAARPDRPSVWRQIPGGVWALGFVSLLMDVSSEMIHALLPVYLVAVMGTSVLAVGFIEGIAEATASVTKVFSGAISDWLGKRKLLAAIGYGMAAFTKPIFPLASTVGWVVAARFIDRIGKGIRGAPPHALVADLSPAHLRGASFGLRQSLDTVGAFVGPLLAILLMWMTMDDFRTVFWIAVIPAFLAFALIVAAVKEPEGRPRKGRVRMPLAPAELARMGSAYWAVVAIAAVFTLARFSEAFLILRAQSQGLPFVLVPLVLVVMNVAYAASSYPAGAASDRVDRTAILVAGLVLLIAADLALAFWPGLTGIAAGVVLWGLHMGLTQGLLSALVADTAPEDLRGTAFGMFNLVSGVALLAASVIAGALWDSVGARGTFLAGAGFAGAAMLGLMALRARRAAKPAR